MKKQDPESSPAWMRCPDLPHSSGETRAGHEFEQKDRGGPSRDLICRKLDLNPWQNHGFYPIDTAHPRIDFG